MSSPTSSLTGEKIYNSSVALGRAQTQIGLIIAIVISVILIIWAFSLGGTPQRPLTNAIIMEANCFTTIYNNRNYNNNYNNNSSNTCTLTVSYKVNDIEYINKISTQSNIFYAPKQSIEIEYEPKNPNNIFIKSLDNVTQSKILVVIAILISGGAFVVNHFAQKNELFAAAQGASTVVNVFR